MRVTLVLTHQCNLACTYCYAGEKLARKMPMETAWKSLALAFRGPREEPVELAFFGGEPMLAFDRLAALTRLTARYARREGRGTVFTVTTNGTVLSDAQLRFLQHYNFYVGVSLDGLDEQHDRHRKFTSGRGSAALVWRNLERAAGALDHLSVNMVLSPDTVASAPAAAARLRSIYVYRLELSPDLDADWDEETRGVARQVYRRLADLYLDTRDTDHPLFVHPFVDEMARIDEVDGEGAADSEESFCALGTGEIAVAPGGSIYPCARLVADDRRADLRIGDIEHGVSTERARQVRDRAISVVRECGADGHCLCVPLMPGDGRRQVENMLFFNKLVVESLREARQARQASVPLETTGSAAGG